MNVFAEVVQIQPIEIAGPLTDFEIMDQELDRIHDYRIINSSETGCICGILVASTICDKCGIELCSGCADTSTCFGSVD